MMPRPSSSLSGVTLAQFKSYLRAAGWQRIDFPNPRVSMFTTSLQVDGEAVPVELALPASAEMVDTERRIAEGIHFLAEITGRSPDTIAAEILSQQVDLYRPRLTQLSIGEYPSLDTVAALLTGMRQFMVAGANHERYVKPVVAQNRQVGQQYVQQCRFGHTFAGSFGFTIVSPISGYAWEDEDDHFGRHVMERIEVGLHIAADAAKDGSAAIITDQYEEGLNANMCETLIELLPKQNHLALSHVIDFSPTLKSELRKELLVEPVHLTSAAIDVLGRAAVDLKAVETERNLTITGSIAQLRDDFDYADYRTVVIKWRDTERQTYRNVYVALDPIAYRSACDAHRDRIAVTVTGKLVKSGRKWRLNGPQGFSVNYEQS